MGALYRTDFFGWTREQAALLRDVEAGRVVEPGELDWLGLAEEIEGLGRSLQWDLYARYKLLLVQLLRARYQPGFNSGSFRLLVDVLRLEVAKLLRDNPSLRDCREEEFADAWHSARLTISALSGLPEDRFPQTCPFTLDQVEDEDFWPDAEGGP
jgi:hypothetical protein